ncbi:Metallo-dependent hydrolase [Dothidotthia symphoricarpi CBS 119687]|uniref:Metallo-dependent hydrolase n=1 Tax=Dothidotthia symphoricarpi CBS 119687 TaxID=1392245 RepID=A0A6A6A597_9PLEO|nr:Metallo-dependent hydrolase [Dothidotthia symphoricarpi CBS 119687]KAF2126345.1 Metallo-dependent hydrolase [Dothidotthia symphoricarpi CBS 119687]
MPTDNKPKTSSDSQRPRQGWLTRCIPTLSVRNRDGSPEDPNKPIMTVADSPKKRRRMSSVPAKGRTPFKLGGSETVDMASNVTSIRAIFDAGLNLPHEVQAYTKDHGEMTQAEEESAWERPARPKGTSRSKDDQIERRAAIIIRAIREFERKVTFGNQASEAIPGPETRDMGGQFLTNKDRIEKESKLYEIAKMVPKGALLHLHFNAELHPERLLEQARSMDHMYIRSIRPLLTQEDLDLTETVFNVLDADEVERGVDIFSPDYPGTATNWKQDEWKWRVWMPWSEFQTKFAQKKFSKKYEQQEDTIMIEQPRCCSEPGQVRLHPAENWLKSKMVLSLEEAYGLTQTVNGVWARFNQATRSFKGLLNYEKVYKWYISEAIERMIEEKIMYAELRPMLLDKFIPTDNGKGKITNSEQMKLIIAGVEEKKAELKKKGELEKFPFGLKIIYCTPRSIPKKMMQEEMKQCIELKNEFPDLICGFDLVGAEDRPNHIGFYKEELIAFRKTCEALKLEIPFLFHAGETLLDTGGSTDPSNSNLYDAVILESKRIGHGFSLLKHPHLMEKFKPNKETGSPGICIELCPISNELLHLCRNIKEHPFPELLAAGIPCTINSDNPSLFSNSMFHEFYQVMVGAPTMSLYSWKQLARWSIEYSCLSASEKIEGRKIHDKTWKQFCSDVVEQYGDLMLKDQPDQIDEDKAKQADARGIIS